MLIQLCGLITSACSRVEASLLVMDDCCAVDRARESWKDRDKQHRRS